MASRKPTKKQLLNGAMALAERKSWEHFRLHDLADEFHLNLSDVFMYFKDKEAIVDAWFDLADTQTCKDAGGEHFQAMSIRERLHFLIIDWLSVLDKHKQVTKTMLMNRMSLGNFQEIVPLMTRLGRTVHWLQEEAGTKSVFVERKLEETALILILFSTLMYWLNNDDHDMKATSDFLDKELAVAETAATSFGEFNLTFLPESLQQN